MFLLFETVPSHFTTLYSIRRSNHVKQSNSFWMAHEHSKWGCQESGELRTVFFLLSYEKVNWNKCDSMGELCFTYLSLWFLICVLKAGCLHYRGQISVASEGLLFLLRKKYKYNTTRWLSPCWFWEMYFKNIFQEFDCFLNQNLQNFPLDLNPGNLHWIK